MALAIFLDRVTVAIYLSFDISRSALADLEVPEMALAIFSGSFANPFCIAAKRAIEGSSRRSANLGAIFHNSGLQCSRALLLREVSLLSFFCPDVCFLWPASAPLSGILTCYRANYCWKCSLDIKTVAFARKGGNTLSLRRRNAISRKTSMRWQNRIEYRSVTSQKIDLWNYGIWCHFQVKRP